MYMQKYGLHSTIYGMARCLSVCLSITIRCPVETAKWIELVFDTFTV